VNAPPQKKEWFFGILKEVFLFGLRRLSSDCVNLLVMDFLLYWGSLS